MIVDDGHNVVGHRVEPFESSKVDRDGGSHGSTCMSPTPSC